MKYILFVFLLVLSAPSFSQCDIKNIVYPDGTMMYYIEPVNFYWTKEKSLKGGIVTDKENYFLNLQPVPFPSKEESKKIKGKLEITLADGKLYTLSHFDTRYLEEDSILEIRYLIEPKDVEALKTFEAVSAVLDMRGDEGLRTYDFQLHKASIEEQLACFLEEKKKK